MRGSQRGEHLVLALLRKHGLEPKLGDPLLPPPLADGRLCPHLRGKCPFRPCTRSSADSPRSARPRLRRERREQGPAPPAGQKRRACVSLGLPRSGDGRPSGQTDEHARTVMERRSLGRDLGLSVRMAVALVLMAVRAEKLPALREPQEPATRNPRVLAAFICEALYWCFVAAFLLGADPFQAAIPVAAVWIAGVVLAIQAVAVPHAAPPGWVSLSQPWRASWDRGCSGSSASSWSFWSPRSWTSRR